MQISVIIPTHKRLDKLKLLLNSLNKQSFPHTLFEVFVIATEDDPAFEILGQIDSWDYSLQITHIPNDPFKGKSPSEKRNYGARLATSPWLAFIDDDCIATPKWLSQAKTLMDKPEVVSIEGHTRIPKPSIQTLAYKGIQRLSRPKGYQTCNMFYRKDIFLELKGFDPAFPFYMEDTDLAWSVIEKYGPIEYCPEATVEHPVPEGEPRRLLHSALRMGLIPYLYKKHPKTFTASGMRAFPRAYFIFVAFDLAAIASAFLLGQDLCLFFITWRLILTSIYVSRLYKGCHTPLKETSAVFYYTLICPLVGLLKLTLGNIKQRTFLFYA